MRFIKCLILFLLLVFIGGCSSKKFILNVSNIKNVNEIKENPVIYALPKTILVIDVTSISTTKIRGPFHEYAKKYLGIDNVIKKNTTKWSISNIDINSYPVVDTNHIYAVESNIASDAFMLSLTPDGLLTGINTQNNYKIDENKIVQLEQNQQEDYYLSYGELSLKNRYQEVYDTIYQEIERDSTFIKIPTVKKQLVKKDLEDQAKELAELILILRDDRSALLVGEGDSEYLPDGEALKEMLDGLDKLEEKYLTMFTGKTIKRKRHYRFEFIPDESKQNMQKILFRFSPEFGILDKTNMDGKPIMLEINTQNTSKPITDFVTNQNILRRIENEKVENNGIIYRICSKSDVFILNQKKEIFKKSLLVAQFGQTLYLPANLFLDNHYSIEFYPEYGSIKSIRQFRK